jgi:hypothetical protein
MLWYFYSNAYSIARGGSPGINGNWGPPPGMSKSPVARRQFIFRNSKHQKTGL